MRWRSGFTFLFSGFLAATIDGTWLSFPQVIIILLFYSLFNYFILQDALFIIRTHSRPPVYLADLPDNFDPVIARRVELMAVAISTLLALTVDVLIRTPGYFLTSTLLIIYAGKHLLRRTLAQSTLRNLAISAFAGLPFWVVLLVSSVDERSSLPLFMGLAVASIVWISEHIKELYELEELEQKQLIKPFPKNPIKNAFQAALGFAVYSISAAVMFPFLRPIPSLALLLSAVAMLLMLVDLFIKPTPKRAERTQSNLMKTMNLILFVFVYDTIIMFTT